uniref:Uracil-DNA glycosylase-like domain-containing protein n=1 Tax=Kwoniella pini CBS 10737 TaxID=1296096 RepID=A0A1B9HZI1_9TREE|nr:uncharacterized protein I206_05462 [Kwoniella pini CBS 10737]OCF48682.1 hypothetical protein I206_05462 [Kwoniella pini CBS 10737]
MKLKVPVIELASPSKEKRAIGEDETKSPSRRISPRKRIRKVVKDEHEYDENQSEDASEYEEIQSPAIVSSGKRSRKGKEQEIDLGILKKSKNKIPRGYAPPEAYSHLRPVNDLLEHDLHILFCGIKDYGVIGKRSSTMGHHFSHPTNKFWRSLHQSGLTPRLLDPTEDHKMPAYGYGLTNLVDRPTSEQSELSTLEMKLNVFNLTKKFLKYQPKLVCFVGKKIWDVYESVISKTATPIESVQEVKGQLYIESKMESSSSSSGSHSKIKMKEEKIDIKEEDIISSSNNGSLSETKVAVKKELLNSPESSSLSPISSQEQTSQLKIENTKSKVDPFNATKPRKYRLPHHELNFHTIKGYTYFWVVPNTSGLERTPLSEQIINFTSLKLFMEDLINDWNPINAHEDDWRDIDPFGVEFTIEEMKKKANQQV